MPAPSDRRAVVAALAGGLAGTVPAMVVASSLSEVAEGLGASVASLGWAISAPLLASAVCVPVLGRVGDLIGHRRLFVVGMAVTAVMSVACCLSWNGPSFVLFRTLTQVAATGALPAAVAILNTAVDVERRAQVFGAWGTTMSVGPALGLVVGGPLVDVLGWPSPFAMQAVLAAVAALLAVGLDAGKRTASTSATFDPAGSVLLGVTVLGILVGLDRTLSGERDAVTWVIAAMILAAATGLVVRQRRSPTPLIPRRLLRSRAFSGPIVALFCMQGLVFGSIAVVPVVLRDEHGFGATAVSMIVAFMPLGFGLASPFGARFAWSVPRRLVVGGAAAMIVAMVCLGAAGEARSVALIALALLLLGAGAGTGRAVYSLLVTNAGGRDDVGLAVGIERMMGQVGGALGVGLMLGPASRAAAGLGVAALVGACLGGLALAVAAWWVPVAELEEASARFGSPRSADAGVRL